VIPALALACYAAAVGVLAPRALLRSAWPHRSPALAVAVWQGLAVSFTVAVALATYHLAIPTGHLDAEMSDLIDFCGLTWDARIPVAGLFDVPAAALPLLVALLPLARFGHEVLRARRTRSRHTGVLDLVGRRSARLRATVLDHELPAVYCLPGHGPRVVVSTGALRVLSDAQLDAVLDHERAHIAGRHHLAVAAAEAFARAFRWLPLARAAREQTAVLLEMAADDRALRRHPRETLATALYEMAAGRTPRGAFAAGGPGALVRLHRMLGPRHRPHPALRLTAGVAAAALPLLPVVVGCAPGMA
jgi:hypothetical protein